MRWMWKRALLIGAVGLTAGGAVGCAEERAPINRVQANALAKSFFIGERLQDPSDDPEFWTQGTLTDVGYGAAQDGLFTSTYAQPASRMKWVVQEDLLIGRLTYERIADTDGKGAGKTTDDGVVVVAYPILAHFDIRRDYNPATGEESNIVVENQSDRPWYEREYMRVDWSRNLNVDSYELDTLSMLGIYGGVTYESLAYYVNDPLSEDAPHFDPEGGYFDVTNKAFATPQMIDLSHLGWGVDKFPACWLDADFAGGGAPSATCNPVEITIRQSFRRVVDKDYEPVDWDGHRFKAYGAFTDDRMGYARNYGMSDQKWHRFISRYNIWERSHFYENPAEMTGAVECYTPATTPPGADPHRPELNANGDPTGTEEECKKVGKGSRCDTFNQRCTLPYRDRTPAPQLWFYTDRSNREFFDGTEWATHEWDVALRSAVQSAKYAECVRTTPGDDAGKKKTCSSQFPVYFGQQDDNTDAIALAREVDDCRNGVFNYGDKSCDALADEIGSKRGYDPGVIALAKMPEMVVLCHSPVQANDPKACGPNRLPEGVTHEMCQQARKDILATDEPSAELNQLVTSCNSALTVRIGDLRYHQINVLNAPQTPSPWGIMTDTEDPLTGEKIAASVNVWSHVNDLFSQGVIDTCRYLKGELQTSDITEGTYVKNWAQASEAASKGGLLPTLSHDEVDQRMASFAGVDPKQYKKLVLENQARSTSSAAVERVHNEARATKADLFAPSANRAIYDARRKLAVGTEFEAKLTSNMMMQQFAGIERLPLELAMQVSSPLRGANASVQRDMRHMKEAALAERGACIMYEAPAPLSTAALADELERKFEPFNPADTQEVQLARAERMRKYVAQRAQYAVIIHEMGHSVGLRHNFVSSSDASGYRPQYWQLRTKNGAIAGDDCTSVTDGEDCVGPRYFDPVTKTERDNLIWMFMQSSVMDYAGESTQDLIGLGAYDFAAARMFYGDSVAVFDDAKFKASKPLGKAVLDKMDQFGGLLGLQFTTNGSTNIHYSQLQAKWNLINNCTEIADPTIFKPKTWNDARDGEWSPLLDGLLVRIDTNNDGKVDDSDKYTRCKQQKVDYVQWQSLGPLPVATDDFNVRPMSTDPSNRTRVPYGFATDRWADLGNVAVYRHDNGADPYEQFNFFLTQQEVNHIFDNYRRNRQSFSVRSAANRILGRYSEKMRDGAKGLTLIRNIYTDLAGEYGENPETLWASVVTQPWAREAILASGMVFDHFTRQMARPEPGDYYFPSEVRPSLGPLDPKQEVLRAKIDSYAGDDATTQVIIPNGASGLYENVSIGGKPLENALASDKGEYDSEYTINAGSYYDKVNTTMLMTESVDNFISDSRKDFLDSRYRATSLADLFPDGYRRWLANNLTGDDYIKGVRVTATGLKPDTDADKFAQSPIGWTSWWKTDGPEVCFPADGTTLCSRYGESGNPFNAKAPDTLAVDPQIGWEQQKFLIAWTLMYLPENAKQEWLNQIRLWERTADNDPVFENRIEFHDPAGKVFIAKTFGTEVLFGKTVQKSISARVLEYANSLLVNAYETTAVTHNGTTTWYVPVIDATTGAPKVKTFYADDNDGETKCSENPYCVQLQNYTEVPEFIRQATQAYGLADPSQKGIY